MIKNYVTKANVYSKYQTSPIVKSCIGHNYVYSKTRSIAK